MGTKFQTSRQQTELFRSRPSSRIQYELEVLRVFVEWAEASQVSKSTEVSLFLGKLATNLRLQSRGLDLPWELVEVEELMKWIEQSGESSSLPEASVPLVDLFRSYRDQLSAYEGRIRNYWLN